MTESAAHVARNGVEAQILWGDDPHARLGDASVYTGARAPLVLTLFGKATVGAFVSGSGSGWR